MKYEVEIQAMDYFIVNAENEEDAKETAKNLARRQITLHAKVVYEFPEEQ
jgi:hypothetical protein